MYNKILQINDLPYDMINSIGKNLSNCDIISLAINKDIYNMLYNDLLDRKNINKLSKILYFYYIWRIIKQEKIKRFYNFCMINYKDEVIIRFLVGTNESEVGIYRELIYHTKENERTIGNYHNVGKLGWKYKSFDKLILKVFNLVMSGYYFDNNCLVSRTPIFKNKIIL